MALLLALAAVSGCRPAARQGAIVASAIGTMPPGTTDAGLVRLDRDGQVVPAVALRWAILGDGTDYLFRIDDAPGRPPAGVVARRLRALLGPASRGHPPWPVRMASIQAVTPTVVEIRLAAPSADFLPMLALAGLELGGAGPFAGRQRDGAWALHPTVIADPAAGSVSLHVEQAGRAVARFRAGAAALVTGGTFADLPVALVAGLDPARIRFDPTSGLFGLRATPGSPYGDPALARALSLALDRDAILDDLGAPGLVAAAAVPGTPPADRLATARALFAARHRALPPLRIAMPAGPGARLLFAHLAHDWRALGIAATAVPPGAPADLVLVDRVLPAGSAAALGCGLNPVCADAGVAGQPSFIAITTPIRWSLVAPGLDGFHPNSLTAHPLDQLR